MSWIIDIPEPRAAFELDRAPIAHPERLDGPTQDRGGLAESSEFYRQLGFEAGYGQAARDQLEFSVPIAEQILQEHGDSLSGPKDARRLLYTFIGRIDRRLGLFAIPAPVQCSEHLMEGGLGI